MFSNPIIRQDLKINKFRILVLFLLQMCSMLLAIGICEMNLIEISDIFWDTIPVILIPMLLEMILAYETITKCKEDGTMDLILATGIKPDKILRSQSSGDLWKWCMSDSVFGTSRMPDSCIQAHRRVESERVYPVKYRCMLLTDRSVRL